jgi:hypothetical protein
MTDIKERPIATPAAPELPSQQEKGRWKPWHKALAVIGIGTAVGGGIKVTYDAFAPKAEVVVDAPADPGQGTGEQGGNNPETAPVSGDYLVPLEDLAKMTPEQITELATISVESVTGSDGKIDWKLYAQKLNDVMLLGTVAGITPGELMAAYDGEGSDKLASDYDDAFIAGFAAPGTNLDGYRQTHRAFVLASEKNGFNSDDYIIRTLELEDVDVVDPTDTSASLILVQHTTDNFFSSGAFSADNPDEVAGLDGRTSDLDTVVTKNLTAQVEGNNIYLTFID